MSINNPIKHDDNGDIELLVHISAPTSVAHDDKYREEASAVLRFIPAKRICVGNVAWPLKRVFLVDEDQWRELAKKKRWEGVRTLKRRIDSQRGRPLKIRATGGPVWPSPSTHLSPLPATLYQPSSSPLPEASIHQTGLQTSHSFSHLQLSQQQKEDKEHRHFSQIFDSFRSSTSGSQLSQIPSSRTPLPRFYATPAGSPPLKLPASAVDEPHQSDVPTCDSTSSSPLSSEPLSNPALQSFRTLRTSSQVNSNSHTPVAPAFPRLSSGPLLTLSKLAPNASSIELPADFTTVTAEFQHSLPTFADPHLPLPPFNCICPLPMLVDPPYIVTGPAPPTNSNPPQIPSSMRNFLDAQIQDKYNKLKKSQSRQLRQWERGYWRIDLTSWEEPQNKMLFWNSVTHEVASGRLGHSVTVLIETEEFQETKQRWEEGGEWQRRNRKEMERRGNTIRVYSWGGVVEYVWAVLYVYGYRGIAGMCWVDAVGEMVVKM